MMSSSLLWKVSPLIISSILAAAVSAAPQTTTPGCGFVSQGCFFYGQDGTPALTERVVPSTTEDTTVDNCQAACTAAGFKYAGLEEGYACFCGNTLTGTASLDSYCNTPCFGNAAQTCGGLYAQSIYDNTCAAGSSSSSSVSTASSTSSSASSSSTDVSTTSSSSTASTTKSSTASSTASSTESSTASSTKSSTASSTASSTESSTASSTKSSTASSTASSTESSTASSTKSSTASSTASSTKSSTASSTESSTASSTASSTESSTASSTESSTASSTESSTASSTASSTDSSASTTASSTKSSTTAEPTSTSTSTCSNSSPTTSSQTQPTYPASTPVYVTSVVETTKTYVISSCAPTVINCPYGSVTTSVSHYTTVCPATSTETAKGYPTPTPEYSGSVTKYTTSTVYATSVYTITSCAPTVTNCPLGHVTTEIVKLYTTVCPVTPTATRPATVTLVPYPQSPAQTQPGAPGANPSYPANPEAPAPTYPAGGATTPGAGVPVPTYPAGPSEAETSKGNVGVPTYPAGGASTSSAIGNVGKPTTAVPIYPIGPGATTVVPYASSSVVLQVTPNPTQSLVQANAAPRMSGSNTMAMFISGGMMLAGFILA
ncbi:hypothetical protein BKA65DRAFT_166725 [Rhexocercosporidium sp. MPI-PUGE-AT-0058]|nr:hypothetical protein BKA65DRAFT_166725 [Rhexocercosporidium sp. MPI-PUGE-AT-0058]